MVRVVITSLADADSARIFSYLGSNAGLTAAEHYHAGLDKLYTQLAAFPESGFHRPGLGSDVRICVMSPYVLVYQYVRVENVVLVLRILHGRRRISRRLLQGRT